MGAFEAFETREAAAAHVATLLEGALRTGLGAMGKASLLVSGGSTPGPVFDQLSHAALDWGDVSVGLVDERWVARDDPRSNAGLVERTLLKNAAAAASFADMKTGHATPRAAEAEVDLRYRSLFAVHPLMLLGMGPDGHTASWFPGADGLEAAMAEQSETYVSAIDATGAPVAGDMPHRMTLNANAVRSASLAVLFITGEEKRAVLEARGADLPVHHAERLLGSRLKTVWAP